MTLSERLWRLLDVPTQLDRLENLIMAQLDTLKASVARSGDAIRQIVVLVPDLREKLAALETANSDEIAGIIASVDADVDAITQVLNPVVADEEVDTGDVEAQPETNPATVDPQSVEGSVPAGQPLPAG